jgi:hypothetical protein
LQQRFVKRRYPAFDAALAERRRIVAAGYAPHFERIPTRWAPSWPLSWCWHPILLAQPDRIPERINAGQRFTIRGSVHPACATEWFRARSQN